MCHGAQHDKCGADDLDALAEAVMLGYLARPDLFDQLAAGSDETDALEVAQAEAEGLATPLKLQGLISPGADVARRWAVTPMSARREIARLLFIPEIVGELRIRRSTVRGRHPEPAVDRVRWREDET